MVGRDCGCYGYVDLGTRMVRGFLLHFISVYNIMMAVVFDGVKV